MFGLRTTRGKIIVKQVCWYESISARHGLGKPASRLTSLRELNWSCSLPEWTLSLWGLWHALPYLIAAVQPKLLHLQQLTPLEPSSRPRIHVNQNKNTSINKKTFLTRTPSIDDLITHNAPTPHPTMDHSEHKCAHFCSERCTVGHKTGVLWHPQIRSIATSNLNRLILVFIYSTHHQLISSPPSILEAYRPNSGPPMDRRCMPPRTRPK